MKDNGERRKVKRPIQRPVSHKQLDIIMTFFTPDIGEIWS